MMILQIFILVSIIIDNYNHFYFNYYYYYLGTIGFGDLVPGASVVDGTGSQQKLVICSLYLLAGIYNNQMQY